jgi:TRAP-type C4-dicarboxylate transport system permease small subunit
MEKEGVNLSKHKLLHILSNLELVISGVFMCVMILIAAVNTFARYLLNSPIYASDEIVLTFFIWTIFLGAAYCYRKKRHIGLDFLVNLMPHYIQLFLRFLVGLILIVTNITMAYLSLGLAANSMIRMIPLLQIPYVVRNSAAFVGFSLMSIYAVYFFVIDLKVIFASLRALRKSGGPL